MKFTLSLFLCLLALGACNKKKSTDDTTVATPTGSNGLTTAELVGNYSKCTTTTRFATATGGGIANNSVASVLTTLTINANESYNIQQYYFSGSVCQMGGISWFAFSQSGTFAVAGLATAPTGATKVVFTQTSSSFTSYATGGLTYFSSAFNTTADCSPSLTLAAASTTTVSNPSATACHHVAGNWTTSSFPPIGTVTYNVMNYNSSTHTITMGTPSTNWEAGQYGSYPTTTNFVLVGY